MNTQNDEPITALGISFGWSDRCTIRTGGSLARIP